MVHGARSPSPVDVFANADPRDFYYPGRGLYDNPKEVQQEHERESTAGSTTGEYGMPEEKPSRERIAERLYTPWPEQARSSLYGELSLGFSSSSSSTTTKTETQNSMYEFKPFDTGDEESFSDIFRRSLSFAAPARPATPPAPAPATPPAYNTPVETEQKGPYNLRKKSSVDYFRLAGEHLPSPRLRSATSRCSLRSPRKTNKASPSKTAATKEAASASH